MYFLRRGLRNVTGSSDYFVRLEQHRWGDGEAQRLCRLEVDNEPKTRWLLERQIGRLCPFENAIDKGSDTTEAFVLIRAI